MNKIMILSLALFSMFVQSCGNSGKDLAPDSRTVSMNDIPDWVLNTPKKDGTMYASSSATSQDMEIATQKAEFDCADKIAGRMESKMSSVTSRVREEIGFGDDSEMTDHFRKVQERMVKKQLKGYEVDKKHIVRENGLFRVYVLVSFDVAKAAELLMREMEADRLFQEREQHQDDMANMRKLLREEYDD
ncbi:MAG: hypothetical protein CMG64_03355 [Candidatus Marinimicrobia bacterium]|nr:hypothetical protein [Candidatus Neomarinimicrobiota bacterium]|tara:strand:- start:28 stop:594 length:567 start_codon:yes stop_codon:yes gene_type:complete